MLVIRKKRIILLSIIIFISLFACSFTTNRIENTVETVALPVTNKVIVLDAGHGVPDEGAQSSTRNNRSTN